MTAAFFVLTGLALQHPETVKRALAEGHTIGLHTWSHRNLTELWEAGDWEALHHEVRSFRAPGTPPPRNDLVPPARSLLTRWMRRRTCWRQ